MIVKMILSNGFDPDPRVYKEAKTLVKYGHDVEILCWDRENRYIDKEYETIEGINIKRFFQKAKYGAGYKQIWAYIKFISEVKNYLKDKDYDVIHGHDIDGFYAAIHLKKKGCKYIWDMHEYYDGLSRNKFKNAIYEFIAKKCFKKVDGIIYVNEHQKLKYKNKIKNDVLEEIIINAPEEENFNDFKRKESPKLRISYTGNIRDFKALKMLMDAGEKFENIEIQINGIGTMYEELKKISNNYKNTIFTGKYQYKDIKRLYENTDIAYIMYMSITDNRRYGCPNKGYESIYTCTPVIVNKQTYFGEYIEKNDIGFCINPNEEELINIIFNIIKDRSLLNLKRKNMERIRKKFLWSNYEEKLIELYNNLFI